MTIQAEAKKSRRGFASMNKEALRSIASKGGKEAHRLGVAHKWSSSEAKIAGKKGGTISRKRPKSDKS
jgi:uncharacterized protein